MMWEPPTIKQVLANQCGPQQLQCPLGWVPLARAYKDVDLQPASQSQLHLHRDSSSGAQIAAVSHLAATLSADAGKTSQLTVTRLQTQERPVDSQLPSCHGLH